jgi:hypothetical protein
MSLLTQVNLGLRLAIGLLWLGLRMVRIERTRAPLAKGSMPGGFKDRCVYLVPPHPHDVENGVGCRNRTDVPSVPSKCSTTKLTLPPKAVRTPKLSMRSLGVSLFRIRFCLSQTPSIRCAHEKIGMVRKMRGKIVLRNFAVDLHSAPL